MTQSILKKMYHDVAVKKLMEKYKYKNIMMVPVLKKLVLSMGVGKASQDKKHLHQVTQDMNRITAQKAMLTQAKRSVSNFKIRKGQVVGVVATLRSTKMYDFLYKFINICVPCIPDFRGFKVKTDGLSAYSLGIKDQTIFPEINLDKTAFLQGMNLTFVTTAKSPKECLDLISLFGMPFIKKQGAPSV